MLRVVTANIQANMPTWKVVADLRRILKLGKPDVIGFQEIGGVVRAMAMRVFLAAHGYGWIQFVGNNRESVPMAYRRKRLRKVRAGSWFLSDATDVGPRGAGPRVLREKHATWAVLQDRIIDVAGLFVNFHLAPSIYLEPRAKVHAEQVYALADLSARYGDLSRCFMGDCNTASPKRLAPLLATGLHMGADVPTHGHNSAIDRILTDVDGERSTLPGHFYTDHIPLLWVGGTR